MKRKKVLYALFLLNMSFYFTACEVDENVSPDLFAEYTLSVNPENLEIFNSEGDNKTITVDAKKTVKSFFDGTHDPEKDVVRIADFNVIIEGDDSFEIEMNEGEIKITAPNNETEFVRKADLIVSLKRKPEIQTAIKLRQGIYPHSGNEFYLYNLVVIPAELSIFEVEGGNQTVEITATKKLMKYVDGEYNEKSEDQTGFAASIEGEGFTVSTQENSVSVTASYNYGYERNAILKITLSENSDKVVMIPLIQKSLLLSPFPSNHVFTRLAEYNIGPTAKQFAKSHQNDASGYYDWSLALSACPEGWHLPSIEEMNELMPPHANYVGYSSTGVGKYTNSSGKNLKYKLVGNKYRK